MFFKALKSKPRRSFRRDTSGAAAVEAALCLPIVMIVLYGCFQWGMFFYNAFDTNQRLDEGAREVAFMDSPSQSEIRDYLVSKLPADQQETAQVTVQMIEQYGQNFAQIDMSYSYALHIPFLQDKSLTSDYRNFMPIFTDSASGQGNADREADDTDTASDGNGGSEGGTDSAAADTSTSTSTSNGNGNGNGKGKGKKK